MKSITNRLIAGALLVLLISPSAVAAVPSSSSSSQASQTPPWFQFFHFRRELLISNPSSLDLVNYPVLLRVGFTQTHLLSGSIELRLVRGDGVEVPSYVIDEERSPEFVTSALLVFFVNIKASANESFWLYYGDITTGFPQYRAGNAVASISQNELSVGLGSLLDLSSLNVNFGTTYSQTLESSVSFNSSTHSFGSNQTANNPLSELIGWHLDGNFSAYPSTVASATFLAGKLRYSRIVVLVNSTMTIFDSVLNSGSSSLNNVGFSLLTNNTGLAKLGPLRTGFYSNPSVLMASVSGAFVGLATNPAPKMFDVGNQTQLSSEVKADNLRGRVSASGPSAGAVQWSFGSLPPGGSFSIRVGWAIASSSLSLGVMLQTVGILPLAKLGEEQTSSVYTPSATSVWKTTISLSNRTMHSSGTSIPLTVTGGVWLPDTLAMNGTVSYIEPSANFSLTNNQHWQSSAFSTGNGTAYSSASFWSVADKEYLARTAVNDPGYNSTDTASLTSAIGTVFGSNSTHLVLRYKASLSLNSGNSSRQQFYAALDIDHNFRGSFDQTLYFPVTGTSTSVNVTSCGQSSKISKNSLNLPQPRITMLGYLIGDGAWRTLDLNLGNWISSRGAQFQVRFCASSDRAFSGQMDLQVESAGIRVVAPAQDLIMASIAPFHPSIDLAFGGSPQSPHELTVNLKMSFLIASSLQMEENQGAVFASNLPEPNPVGLNASARGKNSAGLLLDLRGLVVYTPFYSLTPKLMVNGSLVNQIVTSDGALFAEGILLGAISDSRPSPPLLLSFRADSLSIEVLDANNGKIAGAVLQLRGQGSSQTLSATTDALGKATFDLVPWNYDLTTSLHGSVVSASIVNLDSNRSLIIQAGVYKVNIRVNDALGHSLSGASVMLSQSNHTEDLLSNDNGVISAQLVANGKYRMRVDFAGSAYYQGNLSASTNNALISLNTSYYPAILQLEVATTVVAALFTAGAVIYLPKKFPRIFRRPK